MRFAYYEQLSAESQRTYRKSDAIRRVELPDAAALAPPRQSPSDQADDKQPEENKRRHGAEHRLVRRRLVMQVLL